MTADHDLVILGGTLAGRDAAREARAWGARVALVEPFPLEHTTLWQRQCHQTFLQLVQQHSLTGLAELWQQIPILTAIALESMSIESLGGIGVDLCWGEPRFLTRPQLAVAVGDRSLVGRSYLVATGARVVLPSGVPFERIFTPETLFAATRIAFKSVIVAGGDAPAVELAQAFNHLGVQTTMLVEGDRLLPRHDLEIAQRILYTLEAEGVRVTLQSPIAALKPLSDRVIVSSGANQWEAEALMIATPPTVDGSALEALSLSTRYDYLRVNEYLQTSHPRVFACGEAMGHSAPHRARYEARIAVKNALFWPKSRVKYRSIPETLATDLPLARVGLTEAQARSRYADAVTVLKRALPSTIASSNSIGFCKLLVHQKGQILGAHLIAPHAEEQIEAIALAMRHRLPITALADLPGVADLVQQWEVDRRDRNSWMRSLRETWFHWRR